jgi:hypothetical protein
MALGALANMNTISANELKTKGLGAIKQALADQPDVLKGEVFGIAQRVDQSRLQNHPRDADHRVRDRADQCR